MNCLTKLTSIPLEVFLCRMIHQENFHSAIHYYFLECLGAVEHLLTVGDEKTDLKQVLF